MYYYEVLVASQRYHGDNALTYQSEEILELGQVVSVPLQRQVILGIVCKVLKQKPSFTTKAIIKSVGSDTVPAEVIQLIQWLKTYYPAPLGSLVQLSLPGSLLQTSRKPATATATKTTAAPELTPEQQRVVKEIQAASPKSVLLHGDTGTGKTRVYLELAAQQINRGKSVMILTPEIGLTPQLAASFEAIYGNRVVTLHSNLTPAQRRDRWAMVLEANQPIVVVGPRSALFTPLKNIGLIVMDEAHDSAYKQEQQPYYQASRVAATLASLHKAQLVLGTATPLVADYFAFSAKQLPIVRMTHPAIGKPVTTAISLIELSDRSNFSRSPYLSTALLTAIQTTLERQEQSLLFLNRRGSARLILCEQCGWTADCPNCDLSLTYHADHHRMHCHVCNHTEPAPTQCPSCGHADIGYKSIGTKTLVEELQRLFPDARIQRFDSDLAKHERLEELYVDVKAGEVDILVGTQMLAKGLDLPKLSLVGIVVADTSLFVPDFSAEEHTYQLLSQIMGRVGRGHRKGSVIIQTYHPEHTALQAAIKRDYLSFYEQQITERELFRFPPYVYLMKITLSRASSRAAQTAAERIGQLISELRLPLEVTGPSPSFYGRTHGKYHWQLILRSRKRRHLLEVIAHLPANTTYDIDPVSLL